MKAVIKGSERGRGYFTEMFFLISWFANQFLQCDKAQVGVVDTAPQVAKKLDERSITNYETTDTSSNSTAPYDSVVQKSINFTDYAASFSSTDWAPFSLKIGETTVSIPTKGIAGF